MNRIASPAIGSVAAALDERASKVANKRVAHTFAALRNLVAANWIEVLNVAGATASASLTDISLAVAIAIIANVFKRINGMLPAFCP